MSCCLPKNKNGIYGCMKKIFKHILRTVVTMAALLVTIGWLGTRNLSDTSGSAVVRIAEANSKPNNDFTYSTNPSIERSACRNYPVSGGYHPLTCINTATSFYNKRNTCSYCPDFVRTPELWSFYEVEAGDRKPGDLIIFYRKGIASHAAIYIGEGLFGPLMNHSNGGYLPIAYQKHVPYAPLLWVFWERARYYRNANV